MARPLHQQSALSRIMVFNRLKKDTAIVLFISTLSLLLSIRLFILISNHAINILYWDQWGFFQPLFDGKRWWQLFRWQHGPWRQGAGVLSYLVADLTHWNSRAEAFFIGGLVWLAMVAALWLKRRLFGKLVIYDIAIPMIVLTTAQFQTFAGPVSSAPTAFPMLLIVLYCLAWTVERALPAMRSSCSSICCLFTQATGCLWAA